MVDKVRLSRFCFVFVFFFNGRLKNLEAIGNRSCDLSKKIKQGAILEVEFHSCKDSRILLPHVHSKL